MKICAAGEEIDKEETLNSGTKQSLLKGFEDLKRR